MQWLLPTTDILEFTEEDEVSIEFKVDDESAVLTKTSGFFPDGLTFAKIDDKYMLTGKVSIVNEETYKYVMIVAQKDDEIIRKAFTFRIINKDVIFDEVSWEKIRKPNIRVPSNVVINSGNTNKMPFYGEKLFENLDLNNQPFKNNNGDKAFYGCSKLESVKNINDNTTSLSYAFYNCSKLIDVDKLPNNATNMYAVFSGCSSLINASVIPNNVIDMDFSFEYCTSLVNASVIPNNVTNIRCAFRNCASLVNAPEIPNSVTNMTETFSYCTSLVNAPVIPNNVTDMSFTFRDCSNLVNAPSIPNSVINMYDTFGRCLNLINAPVIPNSVTDMSAAFSGCYNLVNAPIIPNSVTNMRMTFYWCSNLVNAPVIPNSVANIGWAFSCCFNLVNIPIIPSSVTNMWNTFGYCSNLAGNIYINSNQIINATNCFDGTSLTKNVYIPFKYENGVKTLTYNSFINAGYKTDGSFCGVRLKNINASNYTLTINPTPTDATVTLTAEGYTQSGNSITVEEDTTVNYVVSRDGYVTQSGSKVVTANETLDIILQEIIKRKYIETDGYEYTNANDMVTLTKYIGSNTVVLVPSIEEE